MIESIVFCKNTIILALTCLSLEKMCSLSKHCQIREKRLNQTQVYSVHRLFVNLFKECAASFL